MQKRIPHLCGGSFFNLLLSARKPRTRIRNRDMTYSNNSNDHLGVPNVMSGLIKVVTGVNSDPDGKNIGADTTRYRTCQSNGSALIPFDPNVDEAMISGFVKTVKNENSVILIRMTEFCKTYLNIENAGACDDLVLKLLDIIAHDDFSDVPGSTVFYPTCGNNRPVTRDELLQMNSFELEPLLIGILLWILTCGRANTIEKESYKTWMSHAGKGAEWKLRSDLGLGSGIPHSVHVTIHDYSVQSTDRDPAIVIDAVSDDLEEQTTYTRFTDKVLRSAEAIADSLGKIEHQMAEQFDETPPRNDDIEHFEAEVEEDHNESSGAADEETQTTVIRQQTNVVQNGDHNINLTNNGTINFNF